MVKVIMNVKIHDPTNVNMNYLTHMRNITKTLVIPIPSRQKLLDYQILIRKPYQIQSEIYTVFENWNHAQYQWIFFVMFLIIIIITGSHLSLDFPTSSGPNSNISVVSRYFRWMISSPRLFFLRWGKTILYRMKQNRFQ